LEQNTKEDFFLLSESGLYTCSVLYPQILLQSYPPSSSLHFNAEEKKLISQI